ncbi:MAG: DUF423 domain-containing protein [Hyphomonadaceae bacterium]
MRVLNILAALSGLAALVMLVLAAHAFQSIMDAEAIARVQLGAFMQLGAATAGLAIANRSGRLNLIAGLMILIGAALFSTTLYLISLTGERWFALMAPIGGITLISGWAVLLFARPS